MKRFIVTLGLLGSSQAASRKRGADETPRNPLADGSFSIRGAIVDVLVDFPHMPGAQVAESISRTYDIPVEYPIVRNLIEDERRYLVVPISVHNALLDYTPRDMKIALDEWDQEIQRNGWEQSAHYLAGHWRVACIRPLLEWDPSSSQEPPCVADEEEGHATLSIEGRREYAELVADASRASIEESRKNFLLCFKKALQLTATNLDASLESIMIGTQVKDSRCFLTMRAVKLSKKIVRLYTEIPQWVHKRLEGIETRDVIRLKMALNGISREYLKSIGMDEVTGEVSGARTVFAHVFKIWIYSCVDPKLLWNLNPLEPVPCHLDATGQKYVLSEKYRQIVLEQLATQGAANFH